MEGETMIETRTPVTAAQFFDVWSECVQEVKNARSSPALADLFKAAAFVRLQGRHGLAVAGYAAFYFDKLRADTQRPPTAPAR
jgi:hypothetical protein